jgi:phospholipid N-methyltransferase
LLKNKFPKLKIENKCAIDYMRSLVNQDKGEKVGLVLSIPLINNPFREKIFIHELQQFYSSGLLSWCIIYTYGKKSPLSEIGFQSQKRYAKVFRNLPPANVWIYQ